MTRHEVWWICAVAYLGTHMRIESKYEEQRTVEHESVNMEDPGAPETCPTRSHPAKNICQSRPLLSHIQRLQLSRARSEVGMNDVRPNTSNHMGFYTYSFGETELHTGSQQIVYYRVYKSGNDMIRNILKSVSLTLQMPLRHVFPSLNINLCDKSHRRASSRIPFTFFRDPLSRFIAAYGEYEVRVERMCYRSDGDKQHSSCQQLHDAIHDVYLTSALGTVDRVKDAVRMLLHYDGSSSQMIRELGYGIVHFFAQVSVLLIVNSTETGPLQQYRLEQFQQEWERFANTTPVPYHLTGSLQRGISLPSNAQSWHVSQADSRQTKAAAKELFLSRSGFSDDNDDTELRANDADEGGEEVGSEGPEGDRRVYVRAVCRLYLSDYVCLGYPLPADCHDLYDELAMDEQQYHARSRANGYASPQNAVHSDKAGAISSFTSWVAQQWGIGTQPLSLCRVFPPPGVLHWLLSVLMQVPCWWHPDHQECVLGKIYGFPV